MWKAEVLTAWTTDAKGRNVPRVRLDYGTGAYWRMGQKWQDATGQPSQNVSPDPNLYALYIEVEADVLEAIEADDKYHIVWAEEILEEEV